MPGDVDAEVLWSVMVVAALGSTLFDLCFPNLPLLRHIRLGKALGGVGGLAEWGRVALVFLTIDRGFVPGSG